MPQSRQAYFVSHKVSCPVAKSTTDMTFFSMFTVLGFITSCLTRLTFRLFVNIVGPWVLHDKDAHVLLYLSCLMMDFVFDRFVVGYLSV